MANSFEIEGLEELDRQLANLQQSVGKKILKSSLGRSANDIVKKARRGAPKRTGLLRKAIFKSVGRVGGVTFTRGPMAAQVTIGVKRFGEKGAPHAHLMEFGTKNRFRPIKNSRSSWSTGRVKGYYFMRRAWRITGNDKAVARFTGLMQVKIEDAIQ